MSDPTGCRRENRVLPRPTGSSTAEQPPAVRLSRLPSGDSGSPAFVLVSFLFFSSLFFFLILEEKIPLAFEKYKHCREFSSDSSFCGSQETSSTMFKTFTTACEGERSMEIPVVAPRVCPFGLKEPVSQKITCAASYFKYSFNVP